MTELVRCIATQNELPARQAIRFVVGPNNAVFPDIREDLPGEAVWMTADYIIVKQAIADGTLAKAFKNSVAIVEEGLEDKIEILLRKSALQLLSLCKKSGVLVSGFQKVQEALHGKKKVKLLVFASDGAEDGKNKLRLNTSGIKEISIFNSSELAAVLGREHVVHVALMTGGMTKRFIVCAEKLAHYGTNK